MNLNDTITYDGTNVLLKTHIKDNGLGGNLFLLFISIFIHYSKAALMEFRGLIIDIYGKSVLNIYSSF